jgi:hypothetical protein
MFVTTYPLITFHIARVYTGPPGVKSACETVGLSMPGGCQAKYKTKAIGFHSDALNRMACMYRHMSTAAVDEQEVLAEGLDEDFEQPAAVDEQEVLAEGLDKDIEQHDTK